MTTDTTAFHAFERAGWSDPSVAGRYAETFQSLVQQTIEPLLDAAGVSEGMLVLDVASGPGYASAAAARRAARVTGVDFSPAMVAKAGAAHPEVEFREGNALALPFADASFQAVICNFGMPHFADPEGVMAEAFRVLQPGGRFAFSTWCDPSEARGFGAVLGAVQAHGSMEVPLPPGPPFFRFSDTDEGRRCLSAAGFLEPSVLKVPQTWRLPSAEALLAAMAEGTVRTRGLLLAQAPGAWEAIRRSVAERLEPCRTAGGIEVPMPAIVVAGRRP